MTRRDATLSGSVNATIESRSSCSNADRHACVGQLGGEPLTPALGDDRPAGLDVLQARGERVLQAAASNRLPGLAVAEQPRAEAVAIPMVDLGGERVDDLGFARCRRPRTRAWHRRGGRRAAAHPRARARRAGARDQTLVSSRSIVPVLIAPCPPSRPPPRPRSAGRSSQRISSGSPRSGNGISTRVEVAREHGPREDRPRLVAEQADRVALEKCMSASIVTPASRASVAAWAAVEWPVSAARSCSSSANVASCTSRSASWLATAASHKARCRPRSRSCAPRAAARAPAPGERPRTFRRAGGAELRAGDEPRGRVRHPGSNSPGRWILVQDIAESLRDRDAPRRPARCCSRRARSTSPGASSTSSSSYRTRPGHAQRQRDQLAQARRAVDRQRPLAGSQVEGLQQSRGGRASGRRGSGSGTPRSARSGPPTARAGAGSPRRSRTGCGRRRGARAARAAPAAGWGSSRAVPAKKTERSIQPSLSAERR